MTVQIRSDSSLGRSAPKQDSAYRRALTVGIGGSAALHVVVVVLYSVVMTQWSPIETVLGVDSPSRLTNAMRVVRVVEIEGGYRITEKLWITFTPDIAIGDGEFIFFNHLGVSYSF